MKGWFVVMMICAGASTGVSRAYAQATPAVCTPECRSGYLCHQGTCISACNPVCGDAEVCTNAGECVSKCNPMCAANETCTASGQCRSLAPAAPADPGASPGGPGVSTMMFPPAPRSEGWAKTAGTLGIVTAVVVAGLVTVIVIADDNSVGIPLGSVALLSAGVGVPVVASGAASARKSPGVIGSPGMRLAGWIFYGLAMADGLVLLGLAISDADIPPAVTGSVGLLGTTGIVFISLDAFDSAKQAREPAPFVQLSSRPYVGAVRDAANKTVTTAGLAWSF